MNKWAKIKKQIQLMGNYRIIEDGNRALGIVLPVGDTWCEFSEDGGDGLIGLDIMDRPETPTQGQIFEYHHGYLLDDVPRILRCAQEYFSLHHGYKGTCEHRNKTGQSFMSYLRDHVPGIHI